MVGLKPQLLTPLRKSIHHSLNQRLGGPQRLDILEKRKILPQLGFKPWILYPLP